MPSFPIQLKRNGTAAATPSSLLHGEVALNYADGKIFWKDASNVIQSFTFQTYATSSHTHGNITSAGAIGSTANLPIITTTSGVLTTGSFGATAATFCEGNDSRLSDTRTPTDGSVTTAKLANDAVTYAKIQNVSATDRLLGRSSAGAGDVEEITCTSFGRSLIDDADAAAARTTLSVQPTASPAFTGAATFSVASGTSVPLTITNDGTGNSFVVNDVTGDATPFVIDATGNVGIGTSSPGAALDVGSGNLRFSSTAQRITGDFSNATISNRLMFQSSTTNGNTSVRAIANGTSTTSNFAAHNGSDPNNTAFVAIQANPTETIVNSGATGTGTYLPLTFYTNNAPQVQISTGGQLLVTTGSASACGVAFSGDTNTGLAQIGGADTASLVTAGVERVRVNADGMVLCSSGFALQGEARPSSGAGLEVNYVSSINAATIGAYDRTGNTYKELHLFGSVIDFQIGAGSDMRLNADGRLLIGTTTDSGAYRLQVNSQIYATNATIATSDARFKTNVESLTDATAVIEALRPVAFDFLPHAERNFATERQVGLIAQEAQSALAGCDYADSVVAQCGDHLGLAYEKLVPVLIKALQESNARIAQLEERLSHA